MKHGMLTRRPIRLGYFRVRRVRLLVVGRLVFVWNPDPYVLDRLMRTE